MGLKNLADEVRDRGMGLIMDLVPNHVGVADPQQNMWWWHVLQYGRESRFAPFFDIDWSPGNGAGGRLALPVLRSENDPAALTVDRSGPEPMLALHDLRFPIAPGTDGDNALRAAAAELEIVAHAFGRLGGPLQQLRPIRRHEHGRIRLLDDAVIRPD